VAVALLTVAPAAWSQSGPLTDPTLAKLIEESLATRPELAEAAAIVRVQSERAPQAGAWPDPMLQFGVQNDSFTSWEVGKMETSFFSIMLSQTFPWPGKLGLRQEIAELGTGQAKTAATRARLSAEAEVRRAYLALLLARDRLALLDALDDLWRNSAGIARTRYEIGDGPQSDVLQSQLELNRLKQRRWALQAEESTSVQTLNRLSGHPLGEPIVTSTHLRNLGAPQVPELEPGVDDALARSPELAAARLGVTASEKSVSLAKKSYFPDLTVTAGVMPRGGGFPVMWLVTVGGPLPIFAGSKQNRAVAESEARTAADHSRVQAIEQVLRLRVNERRTALSALAETIRLYQEGLLIQSEATTQSTLAQYKVGKVSFASVLQANAGYITDQDGYLQSIADSQRILIASAEVSLDPVAISGGGLMGSGAPGAGSMGSSAAKGMTTTPGPLGVTPAGPETSTAGM
jgi:outer membrane protein TolC